MKIKSVADSRRACSYCPKLCRHACPVAEVEKTELATPTFKQQVALMAASGRKPLDPERARLLYKCVDCSASVTACRHRVPVADSLRDAKAAAVAQGVAPAEIDWLRDRFREHGSPTSHDLKALVAEAVPGAGTTGVGILPACTTLVRDPAELTGALTLMERAGEPASPALPDPPCCGYPLDTAGLSSEFAEHARKVAASLEGFERIATLGAACAWTMLVRYPQVGAKLKPRVGHVVDLLEKHVDRWRSLAPGDPDPRRHVYHDPCFLGRRLGKFDQPRAALRAATGQDPLELGYTRAASICSGGGGVYPLTHPAEAQACAGRVLELARETDANSIVTGCPSARRRLAQANPDAEVRTLVQVLVERTAK